jgi:peptide deformylase
MIITNENDLRVKCEDATLDEASDIILLLEKELENSNKMGTPGVGLAAPQIGIAKKVAIVRVAPNHEFNLNLVNCKIEKCFDLGVFNGEGCLSFPNRVEDTNRYNEIYVVNNLVYPNSFVATGMLAVICQHEIDHLYQKVFIDHIVKKQILNIKIGPNDRCHCGSNIKYKKCCGKV